MKKILSIDGGGIRGIIPALVLRAIEQTTGMRTADLFDLIAGTSTGGILALALAVPGDDGRPFYAAGELVGLYEDHGREIFARSPWKRVTSIGGLADEIYSHENLMILLAQYMRGARLTEACTKVLVTAYDTVERRPFFFKSWRDDYFVGIMMSEAARATSAAPTYFEPHQVAFVERLATLVDGGVYINNPALSAYAEARRLWGDEDLLVVSLGTGELTRPIPYQEAKSWGVIQWLAPLLSVIFDGQSDAVDYQMRMLLQDKYHRFQTRLDIANDDMDDAGRANIEALKLEAGFLIDRDIHPLARLCNQLTCFGGQK